MAHLRLAFPEASISDEGGKWREYFDQCPTMYSTPKMKSFAKRCTHKEVKKMFLNAKCFVRDATDKWNLTGKEPTESTYLGLIGIDESASKECGAVLLDLMLRAGVLHQTNDGEWKLDENWEHRKVYFFGDAKTIENVTKFVRDVQERRLSYSSANIQADIFQKALSIVMPAPGDWHTGLNMLTSLYKFYYDGFLDQFQHLLGWKRIKKDVRNQYQQSLRLLTFVHDELYRVLIHKFVGTRCQREGDDSLSDAQFVARVAREFVLYLREMRSSPDKWLCTCCNFLEMSTNLLSFIDSCRLGDAVGIEYGYVKHLPVWLLGGQNKYVEITYGQTDACYRDHPFSRLQELRINRVVRRYHADSKKSCVSQDLFLEHGNNVFSNFNLPTSLQGFEQQSTMVGVGLLCRNFVDLWYNHKWEKKKSRPTRNMFRP